MRTTLKQALIGIAFASTMALTPAHAVTYQTGLDTISIPGLTGFATTGAMMDGLEITATFSGGLSETLTWAATGATSGGVTGAGWSLSLAGDSFDTNWLFSFNPNANLGQIQTLFLDGLDALTVFDRTQPSTGTPDSAAGADWTCQSGALCDDAIVTYNYLVSIGANAALGDLYQTVLIDFGTDGPRGDFAFMQDTDNDSRLTTDVPEPSTLLLLGAALAAVGLRRRSA